MLDDMVEPPRTVRRLEVITGAGGRRRWSAAERTRILTEAMAPGAVVSVVARRNAMSPQHLFTWLRQARQAVASVRATPLSFVPALAEAGQFCWPTIADGLVRLTAAQLAALLEGLEWKRVHERRAVNVPAVAG